MRTKVKGLAMIWIAIAAVIVMTACGSQGTGSSQGAQSGQGSGSQSGGAQKTTIVIGTAGSSGTYYAVGAGMAQVINNHSDKLTAVSQGTNGATENVRLLKSGDIHVGFGNWDALYFGHNGKGPFNGEKQDTMGLMTLYLSGGQMVVMDSSPIQSYADLKGKKINLGPPGSTITEMSRIILAEYGIDPDKDIDGYYLSFAEGGSKLKDGDLDATFYVAGIPTAGVIDLASTSKIRMLQLDDDKAESIIAKYPYYDKLTIPAGTYQGVDYDVKSLQLWTSLMVSSSLPDDIAYEIIETLIDNLEEFKAVHSVGSDFSLENAVKSPIPLHPGAEKYYKDKGVLK